MSNLRKKYWAVIIGISAWFLFSKLGDWTADYQNKNMDDYVVIPGSYNPASSDSLRNALLHIEFEFAEIKAMVYDSVKGSSYHYIECNFKLNKNYLSDAQTEKKMRHTILNKIFEMFPPDLYTGKMKFEYEHNLSSKVIMVSIHYNQIKYDI
jgi:hypothetical protein